MRAGPLAWGNHGDARADDAVSISGCDVSWEIARGLELKSGGDPPELRDPTAERAYEGAEGRRSAPPAQRRGYVCTTWPASPTGDHASCARQSGTNGHGMRGRLPSCGPPSQSVTGESWATASF